MNEPISNTRVRTAGLIGLALVLILIALVVAQYNQLFTPLVTVQVRADRSGLLMAPSSDVALRDVQVGKVSSVEPDGPNGSIITVNIPPDQAKSIPENVTSNIIAPTVFGPKYVDFEYPARPSADSIKAGDVVQRSTVATEANTVLENVTNVLTKVNPEKVDATLGALSTGLQGRGNKLGSLLVGGNDFLKRFNPSLPTLQKDLSTLPQVTDTFADISPDLVSILRNLSVTSNTVVDKQDALKQAQTSLTGFSDDTRTFLSDNDEGLEKSLSVLRPTTAFLQRYSVQIPCLFASLNQLRQLIEPAIGGLTPSVYASISFIPGADGYQAPKNLPKLNIDQPGCLGAPLQPNQAPFPYQQYNDGSPNLRTNSQAPQVGQPPLSVLLFGQAGSLLQPEGTPNG